MNSSAPKPSAPPTLEMQEGASYLPDAPISGYEANQRLFAAQGYVVITTDAYHWAGDIVSHFNHNDGAVVVKMNIPIRIIGASSRAEFNRQQALKESMGVSRTPPSRIHQNFYRVEAAD